MCWTSLIFPVNTLSIPFLSELNALLAPRTNNDSTLLLLGMSASASARNCRVSGTCITGSSVLLNTNALFRFAAISAKFIPNWLLPGLGCANTYDLSA